MQRGSARRRAHEEGGRDRKRAGDGRQHPRLTEEPGQVLPQTPEGTSSADTSILDFQPQNWGRTGFISSPTPACANWLQQPPQTSTGHTREGSRAPPAGTQLSPQPRAFRTVPSSHGQSLWEPRGAHPSKSALEEGVCPNRARTSVHQKGA